MSRPPFTRSEDHEILYRLLVVVEPGELVSYLTMTEAVGKPVTGTFGPLRSVFNRLLGEDGIIFANQRTVGYARLTPEQAVEESDKNRAGLHRHARRNSRRLTTVDVDFHTLDGRHRIAYAVSLSLFAAIKAATTKNAAKLIETHVKRTDHSRPLPFAETLAAFQRKTD